jgi:rRNA biogenesis protein RRP5
VHAEHARPARGPASRGGGDGGGGDDEDDASDGGGGSDDDADAADADPSAPPPLPAQFAVGQLVRCVVVSLGGAKRIDLSLRLSRVVGAVPLAQLRAGRALPATVRSAEDHGYVLSFGSNADVSGFLLRKHVPPGAALAPGAHIETVVSSVDARRGVVAVTAAPAAVAAAALSEVDDVALAGLLPGALVPARVRAVLADGLQLSFLTYFTGTVDWFQLDNLFPLPSALGGAYAPGAKFKARILFVDAATKRVGLSLRRELVELAPPAPLAPIGTQAPATLVRRVDAAVGLLCQLPAAEGEAPSAGYVHVRCPAAMRYACERLLVRLCECFAARALTLAAVSDLQRGGRARGEAGEEVQARPGRGRARHRVRLLPALTCHTASGILAPLAHALRSAAGTAPWTACAR